MDIEQILKINSNLALSKKAVINVLVTFAAVNSALNNVLKPYEISIQQFNVLRILRGQGNNTVNLETIQERMVNKMSNTSRLIDKLLKKGYVAKKINKSNRRKIDITITQEGLNFLETIDELIDKTEDKLTSSLSEEETKELIRLLGKIRLIANNSL
ncbi:MarR family transcriptional regulator [Flavobacteriaceae bacterium XHP0103]|uniref:MarR family winged helix-turn-helix transcriptional regulator n=1 Tax=Marixanthotalea marina TaxID=2844359 RepID=UPI002989DB96|nr:MarR family transcriptional regulator [Marixanthotalea marina]MBU3821147.1 MarR family transcriptional regulator [Marixanthotalea marina]